MTGSYRSHALQTFMSRNMSFPWICSPKSPPNSPNTELSTEDELKGVYINYGCNKVSFMQSILHHVFFARSGQAYIGKHVCAFTWLCIHLTPLYRALYIRNYREYYEIDRIILEACRNRDRIFFSENVCHRYCLARCVTYYSFTFDTLYSSVQ